MGKIILYVILAGLAAFAALYALNFFMKSKSEFILIAEVPIEVYEDFPASGPPSEQVQVIGMMSKGEAAQILYPEYAKDSMYYKVQLHNGVKGYVRWTSGDVTVQPANKT
ncbi:SH3 domain-containing protein [Halomonas sp. ISL-60]|uniref:SH3 domain-containing protein n=1 Tax=Halomonas sp. ISL-56 TaxID=2819149 RepID=UPI001BEA70E7|nr:SH3 domain-containing protein [Halomonas sp. ISL-56]MBT2773371.1 SH3 domain-containing protein [Halomonas sp. ISL-60]MBT2803670.1 SH3 domain-containing protein [Halomonas sp. ISL-56]